MSSQCGIKPKQDAVQAFMDLKVRKYKYVTYKIDKNEIVIDKAVPADGQGLVFADLEAVIKAMPGPRFIVLDYAYKTKEGQSTSKVMFILWCPDNSNVKDKMLYASCKVDFTKALNGIQKQLQWKDVDDISEEEVKRKCIEAV